MMPINGENKIPNPNLKTIIKQFSPAYPKYILEKINKIP